jgi:1,4-alpha-glucan branching enzyme
VSFTFLEPDAERVALCGDFNRWAAEATPMKRRDDGSWEVTVALAPGRHEYKFLVDGQWIPDPLARENVWNDRGSLNSVVVVGT